MYQKATLRSPLWNAVSAVVLAAMAGGCVAVAMEGSVPGAIRVPMVALALTLLVGVGRVLTLGVLATPDALVLRELFRTYRVPWGAVRGVGLNLYSYRSVPTAMPELRYVDAQGCGRTIRVAALGARRTAAAQRNVDELKELISANRLSAPSWREAATMRDIDDDEQAERL